MSIENNELIMSALDKIVKIGKKKGVLTVDEVTRALVVDADASRTDVEEAFEYLEKQHVLVVESQQEEVPRRISPPTTLCAFSSTR